MLFYIVSTSEGDPSLLEKYISFSHQSSTRLTIIQRVIVVGASVSSVEIIYEILDFVKGPLYASVQDEPIEAYGWVPFEHPKVSVKPAIKRLDPQTGCVHFTDGSYLDNVDHIIYGTGYTFSFPFLPKIQDRIKMGYRRLPGVYQHTWDIEDPTLTFVGMVNPPVSPTFRDPTNYCRLEASHSAHTNGKP
jgi:hypothetical protein